MGCCQTITTGNRLNMTEHSVIVIVLCIQYVEPFAHVGNKHVFEASRGCERYAPKEGQAL